MFDSLLVQFLYAGAAIFLLYLWIKDYRAQQQGMPLPASPLPGAFPASRAICLIAVAGAVLLLLGEVAGEYALDLVDQQTEITLFFGLITLGAAIIEEIIFRGYLVVTKKGRLWLIGSIVFFSLIFALIHGHFWDYSQEEGLEWTFTTKAYFTTTFLFLNSLWFYAVRFLPWNTKNSLLPCFLAHATSNLGVVVVKALQGYVVGF